MLPLEVPHAQDRARQQEQLPRATAIAQRDHVVATPGSNNWWLVEHPTPGRRHAPYHLVRVLPSRLQCDVVARPVPHLRASRLCIRRFWQSAPRKSERYAQRCPITKTRRRHAIIGSVGGVSLQSGQIPKRITAPRCHTPLILS
jgi:hypothetical protein